MARERPAEGGDYEYDLAHGDVPPQRDPRADQPSAAAARGPRPVAEPPTPAQDYPEHDLSYDLAHDVPASRPPGGEGRP